MSLLDQMNHLLSNLDVEDVLRMLQGALAAWRLSTGIARVLVRIITKLQRRARDRRRRKDME